MPDINFPPYWEEAKTYLSARDPVMARLIGAYAGEGGLQSRGSAFNTLMRSIIGQQVSVSSAEAVTKRLEALLETVMPEALLKAEEEHLRSVGLSRQKIAYLRNISEHFLSPDFKEYSGLSDEEVRATLIKIKGIGHWTIDMFLIFHLMRPDVLPLGDLGIVKAIQKQYDISDKSPDILNAVAEPWKPFRTVASWYLWRSLDPVAINY